MYGVLILLHILLAVTLQQDDGISGHALAARKVALSIARGSGAKLTVLIVYDYGALDLSLSLPAEDLSRYRGIPRDLVSMRRWSRR